MFPSASSHVLKLTAASSCITSAFIVPWKIGLAEYRKRDARGYSMSSSVDSSGGSNRFSIKVDSIPTRLKVFIDNSLKEYPDNPLPFALSAISYELESQISSKQILQDSRKEILESKQILKLLVEEQGRVISMKDDEISRMKNERSYGRNQSPS